MQKGLEPAEAALARGDYGQCLALLKPLAEQHPLPGEKGGEIRMLIVTALMGQGEEKKAKDLCRLITQCKNSELRQRSKQLLEVLEAPSLQRPENWSVHLPSLELGAITGTKIKPISNNSKKKSSESEKFPPTGPTQNPGIGFSSLVLVVIICLTILLSGCVQINTNINISGPDKINLNWTIETSSKKLLPWQLELENSIKSTKQKVNIKTYPNGKQEISSHSLNSSEANLIFKEVFQQAADLIGIEIEAPKLNLKEKNLLVGVKQDLNLVIDLTNLPNIPGLNMIITISPTPDKSNLTSKPNLFRYNSNGISWPLAIGEINKIELHMWSWSQIGIGAFIITFLMIFSFNMQSIRIKLGYGFPELPP